MGKTGEWRVDRERQQGERVARENKTERHQEGHVKTRGRAGTTRRTAPIMSCTPAGLLLLYKGGGHLQAHRECRPLVHRLLPRLSAHANVIGQQQFLQAGGQRGQQERFNAWVNGDGEVAGGSINPTLAAGRRQAAGGRRDGGGQQISGTLCLSTLALHTHSPCAGAR